MKLADYEVSVIGNGKFTVYRTSLVFTSNWVEFGQPAIMFVPRESIVYIKKLPIGELDEIYPNP